MVIIMGKVALTFNINLSSPDVDADKVKAELEKMDGFTNAEIKLLAFGMKQIIVMFQFDDKKGADTDVIEKAISEVQGVASVETGDVTLI